MTTGDEGNAATAVSKVTQGLEQFTTFSHLERMTSIPKVYVFVGLCATFVTVCWVGLGAVFFSHLISLFYPAYRSFKAISQLKAVLAMGEDPKHLALMQASVQRASKYLMYWVVYGCFNVVEYVCGIFLMVIPFYWPLKMLFLLWCVHPDTDGTLWVYERVVAPFLSKHEPLLDAHLGTLQTATTETYSELRGDAAYILRKNRVVFFEKAANFFQRVSKTETQEIVQVKKES